MAEKSARILLVCKRFFQTKMRPYLAANAITIANSGLKDGTIMEQKAILRSFVKRIVINPPDVTLEYTAPLLEEKEIGRTTETAVLPML